MVNLMEDVKKEYLLVREFANALGVKERRLKNLKQVLKEQTFLEVGATAKMITKGNKGPPSAMQMSRKPPVMPLGCDVLTWVRVRRSTRAV